MHLLPKDLILSHLDKFLEQTPLPEDLWVFAYGSLLWNPEMHIIESRHGLVQGFNLLSTVHRGTPEAPGLVLSLRDGGCCEGLALKVNPNTKITDFTNLWLREMVTLFYQPKWCKVTTSQGSVQAITFVADTQHKQFVDFDCQTMAKMIHRAHGGRGPNIDYFNNTHKHLQSLGIQDPLFASVAQHFDDLAVTPD